jgi:hypothetical protein
MGKKILHANRNRDVKSTIAKELISLPGNLFDIPNLYFNRILSSSNSDLELSITNIGRASERLAKGILRSEGIEVEDKIPFYKLIDLLIAGKYLAGIEEKLRPIQKFRNITAHDSDIKISEEDVLAMIFSFSSAYRQAFEKYRKTQENNTIIVSSRLEVEDVKGDLAKKNMPFASNSLVFFLSQAMLVISAIMLVIAVFVGGDYRFFGWLRLMVTATSILVVVIQLKTRRLATIHKVYNAFSSLVHMAVVILFNPIIPVYLQRDIWIVIDTITLLAFVFSIQPRLLQKNLYYKRVFRGIADNQ